MCRFYAGRLKGAGGAGCASPPLSVDTYLAHTCPPPPLAQAGLHQLIMQQTYTQLPPGMPGAPGQFGQQLGLSASWLGSLPGAPSSGAPQSSMGVGMGPSLPGLETLSNMQQAMSSQVGLGAWVAVQMGSANPWKRRTTPPCVLVSCLVDRRCAQLRDGHAPCLGAPSYCVLTGGLSCRPPAAGGRLAGLGCAATAGRGPAGPAPRGLHHPVSGPGTSNRPGQRGPGSQQPGRLAAPGRAHASGAAPARQRTP